MSRLITIALVLSLLPRVGVAFPAEDGSKVGSPNIVFILADDLYWDQVGGQQGGPPRSQAVRFGDWKAVRMRPGRPLELYDLATDVGESRNVADKHPMVVRQIEAYLHTATTPCRVYPPQEPTWSWERRRTGFVR